MYLVYADVDLALSKSFISTLISSSTTGLPESYYVLRNPYLQVQTLGRCHGKLGAMLKLVSAPISPCDEETCVIKITIKIYYVRQGLTCVSQSFNNVRRLQKQAELAWRYHSIHFITALSSFHIDITPRNFHASPSE